MGKRTREIAALVLLAMLGVGAVCAMVWYIFAGHGWNVAASNIDDSIGQMDGYTVILLEGTREPAEDPAGGAGGQAQSPARSSSSAASGANAASASAASAAPSSGDAPGSGAVARPGAVNASSSAASRPDNGSDEADPDTEGMTIDELRESYHDKGAEVFVLDAAHPEQYRESMIVTRGNRRVGICFVDDPARLADARVQVKLLDRHSTDLNFMLCADPAFASVFVPGLDVLIDCNGDANPQGGTYLESMFGVSVPERGFAQAVIVSPSGVVSSKRIAI